MKQHVMREVERRDNVLRVKLVVTIAWSRIKGELHHLYFIKCCQCTFQWPIVGYAKTKLDPSDLVSKLSFEPKLARSYFKQ